MAHAKHASLADADLQKQMRHMSFHFQGCVAFVTGGGMGIGRSICVTLARAGARVMVLDINEDAAKETAKLCADTGVKAIGIAGDVRNYKVIEAAAQRCVEELGGLDFCVANAGIARVGSVLSMGEEEFRMVLDINMMGVFHTVKACAREMVRLNKGGKIVTVASANSVIAQKSAGAYCGSKAAVAMMTRCWSQDLVPYGITVNCVGPGATDTAMTAMQLDNDEAKAGLLAAIPVGRMAHPDEVAQAVAFYCSENAVYITGSFLLVDGGLRDHEVGDTPSVRKVLEARRESGGDAVLAMADKEHAELSNQFKKAREQFNVK